MRWSFKLHGGIAAVLGAAALSLAVLTWLPGTLPLYERKWPMVAVILLALLSLLAAVVRLLATGAHKSVWWQAFRCLPGRVQASLAVLALAGVVILVFSLTGQERLQDAEVRDGRYVAYDATARPGARMVELSRDEYLALLPSSRRTMFALPGLMSVGAAAAVLVGGELRRADAAAVAR